MLAAKSSVHFLEHDPELAHRCSISRAQEWFDKHGWVVGCNYIPSNAINQLEMWQADTFDVPRIQQELSWAKELGFNTVRVFLHHMLWEQDAPGFYTVLISFSALLIVLA